ncbi:autoinducer synthase [Novosphingobium sp. G106]|uniref:acyl-homoserine-lactone synthase n=1 Tax=Novosphingobium sp. G106 TaxID=2849500 RepID=UPI001C2DF044|nr:acyl-homoserine-lactone synthase [Novosphingobium sp. G106]MBV1691397.1 autoinducer synthase [Novosphingobium sp. G106]
MIHTLDHMSEAEGAVLRAMFEARKHVFVDLLKWDIPVLAGTWELDQFDDREATYLIISDGNGGHFASSRLLKTVGPHILGELYPDLVDGEVPSGANILEITRFCLDRSLRAAERRHARDRLVTALTAYAIEHGITAYTGVAEIGWFRQIANFGWRCALLGLPRIVEGRTLVAMRIEIDHETPELLAAGGIWTVPAWQPSGMAPELRA